MTSSFFGSIADGDYDIRNAQNYSADGAVVVGVSASSGSPVAVAWAHDIARHLCVPLVAVRAYRRPSVASRAFMGTRTLLESSPYALWEQGNAELIEHVVAAIGEKAAKQVVYRVVEGERRRVLCDSSRNAALLVIDAPPNRGFGVDVSFSNSILAHAQCPVVTMPPRVAGY